jgi:hypothetical protein
MAFLFDGSYASLERPAAQDLAAGMALLHDDRSKVVW